MRETLIHNSVEGMSTWWFVSLLVIILLTLVTWQYAQRRTAQVRAITAGAYLVMLIPTATSVTRIGPPHPEVAVRYAPEGRRSTPMVQARDKVVVALPIAITGRDRNLAEPTLIRVRIQSGASRWQTPWDWQNQTIYTGSDWLVLAIPEGAYDRFRESPATVQAEIAVTVYDLERSTSLSAGGPWISLGASGQARLRWNGTFLGAERRMALYDPGYKLVCTLPTKQVFLSSVGIYPRDPGELHISPVFHYGTNVGNFSTGYVNVQVERPTGNIIRTRTIPNVRLEDWVLAR
jgi:hypothetical protein